MTPWDSSLLLSSDLRYYFRQCASTRLAGMSQWKSLVSTFQGVSTSIPRCYFLLSERLSSTPPSRLLWCFQWSVCSCHLLKFESEGGNVVNFVASKTRVAPTTKQTIPRLELLSALLLSNLISNVSEIELKESCCYTDACTGSREQRRSENYS